MNLYAGIEAGGTKFVCAIGNGAGKIHDQITIPTTTPKETMKKVIDYFKKITEKHVISSFGIGSFGPIDLDQSSPTYGYITSTPKTAWINFNIFGAIKEAFKLPVGFDTDVNGAAFGEHRWGAAKGLDTFIYVTIGTGIGAGGMVGGKMIHGLVHPEMGHSFIPHNHTKDPFQGVCPYHGDCFEGLASGPAMIKRWNVESALDLPTDHPAWDLEAEYIAYAVVNYIYTLSPQKIILGGGVMQQQSLFKKIHAKVQEISHGYIQHKAILNNIEEYIVYPELGTNAGICGALALAEQAHQDNLIDSY